LAIVVVLGDQQNRWDASLDGVDEVLLSQLLLDLDLEGVLPVGQSLLVQDSTCGLDHLLG
jgi:hypothetical protein